MLNKSIIYFLLILVVACTKASTIQPASTSKSEFEDAVYSGETAQISKPTLGEDQYRIFHQAATGFISVQTIRESAEKRATEFCGRENRRLKVIQETASTPPHVLGNWPRIELIFECLPKTKLGFKL
jgi:hypothetical protein